VSTLALAQKRTAHKNHQQDIIVQRIRGIHDYDLNKCTFYLLTYAYLHASMSSRLRLGGVTAGGRTDSGRRTEERTK